MKKFLMMVTTICILMCAQAYANDGHMLREVMFSENEAERAIGIAYVTGAYEMAITSKLLCPVEGVLHDDMVGIVAHFLVKQEQALDNPASLIVGAALIQYFPCNKEL